MSYGNYWREKESNGLAAGTIILILKIAVVAVSVLLVLSLWALACGNFKLHGRINLVFFALTLAALLGLEVVARLLAPAIFAEHFEKHQAMDALRVHLGFSLPATGVLLFMPLTGLRHRRRLHVGLGLLFLVLWTGTFVTGVFFLPHENL
ncbi:MAG: hypothetical protein L0Y72_18070 [Gemmataceae bacterium]|nr:hypothetical protein [Gemmataceae bacterium]MCI0740957.1 hypothetical protein [Gemmataceae bacterium]